MTQPSDTTRPAYAGSPRHLVGPERVFALQQQHRWQTKRSSAQERIARLRRLRDVLIAHAEEFITALYEDLCRPPERPTSLEFAVLCADLDHTMDNLSSWMTLRQVEAAPLLPVQTASETSRFLQYEAMGVVLVLGAWNQPFMLSLQPLISAIAAGNTAIVKPSERAPASSHLIARMIREAFDEREVAVFEGGVDMAERLLRLPVDHIFFTGSPSAGRKVAAAAAGHLASVTLELGGKSAAIVDGTTDLAEAAAVIAEGKLYNAGQDHVGFDYAWIVEDARDEFVGHYMDWVRTHLYEGRRLDPRTIAAMVDQANFDRVVGFAEDAVQRGAELVGTGRGDADILTVEPTVLINVPFDADIMTNEVFGPLLPVITFSSIDEVIGHLQSADKPLAMYPITTDCALLERLLAETSSCSMTVHARAAHALDGSLPFGGMGSSGNGRCRGELGFQQLSRARSVVVVSDTRPRRTHPPGRPMSPDTSIGLLRGVQGYNIDTRAAETQDV